MEEVNIGFFQHANKRSERTKNSLYGIVQTAFWSWYFVSSFFVIILPKEAQPLGIGIIHLSLETAVGFFFSVLLAYQFQRIRHWQIRWRVILSFFLALLFALLWTQYKWLSYTLLFEHRIYWQEPFFFGLWFNASSNTLIAWSAGYYAVWMTVEWMLERVRSADTAKHLSDTKLKMLRYQLNPHFHVNMLNAISTMVLKKQNEAVLAVLSRLADYLSDMLDREPDEMVTLAEELASAENYLALEKLRFGDRITHSLNIDPPALHALLPSMILQPLLENAVRFVCHNDGKASIQVHAKLTNGQLVVEIIDDAQKRTALNENGRKSRGIGLGNAIERLNTIYGERAFAELISHADQGSTVRITLPHHVEKKWSDYAYTNIDC